MLALTPAELAPTDTTQPAIDAFTTAGIREIVMVGRRGHRAGRVHHAGADRASASSPAPT